MSTGRDDAGTLISKDVLTITAKEVKVRTTLIGAQVSLLKSSSAAGKASRVCIRRWRGDVQCEDVGTTPLDAPLLVLVGVPVGWVRRVDGRVLRSSRRVDRPAHPKAIDPAAVKEQPCRV